MDNLITRRFSVAVTFPATELGAYRHTPYPELPGACYDSYAITTTVITKPALEQYLNALESEWEGTYDDESFKLALNLVLGKVRSKFNLTHLGIPHHWTDPYKPVVSVTNLRPYFAGDDLSVHCTVDAGNTSFSVTCGVSELVSKVQALYVAAGLYQEEEFEEAFLDFLSRTPATSEVETSEAILALGIHNVHVTVKPFD